MKRIVKSITGTRLSDSVSIDFDMLPGTGSLDIDVHQTEHGPVTGYQLAARLRDETWADDPVALEGEYQLLVTLDDGTVRHLGTSDIPASIDISLTDTIGISCSWEYPTGWLR